jgi:CP family cyanate transporter-like MFS transporter
MPRAQDRLADKAAFGLQVSGMPNQPLFRGKRRPSQALLLSRFVGLGLLLASFNLRPALSSLATMLAEVERDLHVSGFWTGMLTTMPVLCFGLFGPLAPLLSARIGLERAAFLLMLMLAAGLGLRAFAVDAVLIVSTLIAGASIGMVGVLLPVVIKRDFHNRLGMAAGLYTMVLSLGGASAAGLSPTIEQQTGTWTAALAAWSIPALAAALIWGALSLDDRRPRTTARLASFSALLRDPVAWYVTAFMGLQAALAFIVLGWLPTLLRDRGLGVVDAGFVTSISIISQTATALLVPLLAARHLSPAGLVLAVSLAACVGFLGLACAPLEGRLFWALVMGLGQGGLFGLALLFIPLRSSTPTVAAMLSSMAQSIGYIGAALGPFAVSLLRDIDNDPTGSALLFAGISLVGAWCGVKAARPQFALSASNSAGQSR